jgi:hypothetical protein
MRHTTHREANAYGVYETGTPFEARALVGVGVGVGEAAPTFDPAAFVAMVESAIVREGNLKVVRPDARPAIMAALESAAFVIEPESSVQQRVVGYFIAGQPDISAAATIRDGIARGMAVLIDPTLYSSMPDRVQAMVTLDAQATAGGAAYPDGGMVVLDGAPAMLKQASDIVASWEREPGSDQAPVERSKTVLYIAGAALGLLVLGAALTKPASARARLPPVAVATSNRRRRR